MNTLVIKLISNSIRISIQLDKTEAFRKKSNFNLNISE